MNIVDSKRKIRYHVNGEKWIFNYDGILLEKPEGAAEWIENALSQLSKIQERVSGDDVASITSPEGNAVEVEIERYIDITVGQILDEVAAIYPDKEALISFDGTKRITFKQFKEDSDAFAKYLIDAGVKKGEKIGLWMANGIESMTASFGISKAGAVMVPFNTYEKQEKMEFLLERSDVSTLILYKGAKVTEVIELLIEMFPGLESCEPGQFHDDRVPMLKSVILVDGKDEHKGIYDYATVMEKGRQLPDSILIERRKEIDVKDMAYIIFTSGSTGVPKGVMLHHLGLVENSWGMCQLMELSPEDKMCMQVQLFHTFGCVASGLTSIMSGMPIVLTSRFKPGESLDMIAREKCTVVSGVPTMFIGFIAEIKEGKEKGKIYDVSSMRTGIVAGAPCPIKMIEEIETVMNMKDICVCYGLTETSPCVSGTRIGDSLELKGNSVGAVLPGVQVKLVDPETLEDKAPGEPGEICIKGYSLMMGYLKQPEETAKTFIEGGWMRTGDTGSFLPNGYLVIGDRLKDVIIRSGENLSPQEIEEVLKSHPDVDDAYAIGVPDYKYGEIVGTFVKLRKGSTLQPKELRAFCVGKLQTLKIPSYYWFMDELPQLANGKIDKVLLRKIAKEEKDTKEKI